LENIEIWDIYTNEQRVLVLPSSTLDNENDNSFVKRALFDDLGWKNRYDQLLTYTARYVISLQLMVFELGFSRP
jgi:hypothetical protein